MPLFEVPIVYEGQCNYLVKADNAEEAKQIAKNRYDAGTKPDILGNEWECVKRFGNIVEINKIQKTKRVGEYQITGNAEVAIAINMDTPKDSHWFTRDPECHNNAFKLNVVPASLCK